ncbi:MAG: zf-TFIIB domain-containing protein [Arhodomonas sp.]|nr:zf-TFIIB domain-containing protein [Arhodomonas sp.]
MTEREGVEIDYCPKCRGVWLDRGELDKIIERYGRRDRAVTRHRGITPATPRTPGGAQQAQT